MVVCDQDGRSRALRTIKNGGVIIFPTDTVYGIGCDPHYAEAVKRIYHIKSRDPSKPLPILVDSIQTAQQIAEMSTTVIRIAEKFWPGPLTIILKPIDMQLIRALNLQTDDGIAIRVPNHKCILEILQGCKMLVGTSANVSGRPPTGDPAECGRTMHDYDLLVDGGTISNPTESSIIDARNDKITMVRRGMLRLEDVLKP